MKKISQFLFLQQGHDIRPHPLQFIRLEMVTLSVYFNVKTTVRR